MKIPFSTLNFIVILKYRLHIVKSTYLTSYLREYRSKPNLNGRARGKTLLRRSQRNGKKKTGKMHVLRR